MSSINGGGLDVGGGALDLLHRGLDREALLGGGVVAVLGVLVLCDAGGIRNMNKFE